MIQFESTFEVEDSLLESAIDLPFSTDDDDDLSKQTTKTSKHSLPSGSDTLDQDCKEHGSFSLAAHHRDKVLCNLYLI